MWERAAIAAYGLLGAVMVTYGLYLWWPPAAWMFAGAFAITDAWLLGARWGLGQDDKRNRRNAARKTGH